MKNARGSVLMLLLVAIAAALALGALVEARIADRLSVAREDAERWQALWLARSAAALGKVGDRTVAVRGGPARVHVAAQAGATKALRATVTTPSGAVATAMATFAADGTVDGWQERYDAAGAGPARPQ